MAFNRFIKAILKGDTIHIYGDGKQTRDFTFVADAVQANISAMTNGTPGGVYNIGGGSRISVNDVLAILGKISGIEPKISYEEKQKGDVQDTCADTTLAKNELLYNPQVGIEEGLRQEFEWLKGLMSA